MEGHDFLAQALAAAKVHSKDGVLKGANLDRGTRELLTKAGCLTLIIRGWYLLTVPGAAGHSTAWFGGIWHFLRYYLVDRFGTDGYCLSAETSVDRCAGESALAQLTVLTAKPSNQTIALPHHTSVLLYQDAKNFPQRLVQMDGINVMPLALALSRLTPSYYKNKGLNAEIALKMLPDATEISRVLLTTGAVTAANRIAGAYQHLGDGARAEQIVKDMAAAGMALQPQNPFATYMPRIAGVRLQSPYAGRIEALWQDMRGDVIKAMPYPSVAAPDVQTVVREIREISVKDAYNSLSIEGYQVSDDLIERIARGEWNPSQNDSDQSQRSALAAKGYVGAFNTVLQSLVQALNGKQPGEIFAADLQSWYRDLFAPVAQAGLLRLSDLAGYRNAPVYIDGARHIPPGAHGVLDSMVMLFRLLQGEEHPAVRAVLGHYIFVYIHPYMDGNGRIGRFVMNFMLASGGYPWTIIRMSERARYMSALDQASAHADIAPFAAFIASEIAYWQQMKAYS